MASNIISVIIKSVVNSNLGDGLGSELIGIPIDEYSEKGIEKIKDFINGEKSKIEYILSEENMQSMNVAEDNIAFVVAEIKDLLSKIKITDEVFRKCRYSHENLKDFLWNEYRICKSTIENEIDIKKGLYAIAKALIGLKRKSDDFENEILIQISNSVDDVNVDLQKISDYMEENYGKLDDDIKIILERIQDCGIKKQNIQENVKSRTQEYADKWNKNMFLNDFDKRDEKAGVNVKLREIYLEGHLPHYKWNTYKSAHNDLKDLLTEYMYDNKEKKMLLVLGQPGIGKSTLITWITANFIDKTDDILVYQFASDLKSLDWKKASKECDMSIEILKTLHLSYKKLNGKVLILDGFDEISVKDDDREEILNQLYWVLIKESSLNNFSLIITCRENYIENLYRVECDYITLQALDEAQIESFCEVYQNKTGNIISKDTMTNILRIREILGIPLILYMVLALDISLDKEGSIVDVYDRIFSLGEEGIYERCFRNLKKDKLDRYDNPHWIYVLKKQIHQISREIAIWMFENNSEEASIPQEEYQRICTNVMRRNKQEIEHIEQDFKIGNYFKVVKHCEGVETEELIFIHRTIYEYFVAETIYSSIENAVRELSDESQEKLAGNIAVYLGQREVTKAIIDYFDYKILKLYKFLSKDKKDVFFQWWEETIEKMMNMGMFYYTQQSMLNFKNIIRQEMQCFMNLLKILRGLVSVNKRKYIMRNTKSLRRYMEFCRLEYSEEIRNKEKQINFRKIHLAYANLKNTVLSGIHLEDSNLRGANLTGADLSNSYLQFTCLVSANLSKANLVGANLTEADLREADLDGAIFDEKQIVQLEKRLNLQGTRVFIEKTDDVISYEEYCKRK